MSAREIFKKLGYKEINFNFIFEPINLIIDFINYIFYLELPPIYFRKIDMRKFVLDYDYNFAYEFNLQSIKDKENS